MTVDATPPQVDIQVTEVIRRPVAIVADYASDPTNAPHWYANITEVVWQTPRPLEIGTEVAFVARFLGRELRYTYAIVECAPDRLVMRTAQGPFPMETSYHFEPLTDGTTRVTLRNQGSPSGFSRLLAPFVGMAMRRATQKDLAALKRILEGSQPAGPSSP